MRFYAHLFAVHMQGQMQYRVSLLLSTVGQFMTAFTTAFGIRFLFAQIHDVEGFTYGQTLLCFAVVMMSFALGEMVGGGFATFPRMLSNGEFDRALARPRSAILQVLVPKVDFTRMGLLIQAVLVLIYAMGHSGVTWTGERCLTLALMILCGSALFFGLFLVFAACSFFTVEGLEFLNLFTYGGRQFGRYPLSIYGNTVLKVLTFCIPLATVQYYPLLFVIGRTEDPLHMLAPLLGLLFLVPSYGLWRLGLYKYRSTGS